MKDKQRKTTYHSLNNNPKLLSKRVILPFAENIEGQRSQLTFFPVKDDKTIPDKTLDIRNEWTIVPLYLLLFAIFLIILFRSWQIQIIEGKKYLALAEENRIRFQITDTKRGIVYDKDGEVIARNAPGLKVYFSPYNLSAEEKDKVISSLSNILKKDKNEIIRLVEEGEKKSLNNILIKNNIDHETEISLISQQESLSGVKIEEGVIRDYLEPLVFSHIIGYTGELTEEEIESESYRDYFINQRIGRIGLEQYYEHELKGTLGQKLIEVDANGDENKLIYEAKPLIGSSLVLTLDADLQRKVYEQIENGVKEYASTGGVGIFQDIKDGRVLAMVSYPSYDNNLFAKGVSTTDLESLYNNPQRPLFNRAISGTYPSGSTIKPLVGAAALEEGIISANTTFNDRGLIEIGTYRFPDWKVAWGLPPNGPISVIDAIAQSCDTFFYAVGGGYETQRGLGMEKLQKYARLFGLGQKTGIDLPGEEAGFYPSPEWKQEVYGESWYLGDTYWVSIGQSYVLVTPLQLNNYVTTLASDGILYEPFLVKEILNEEKDLVQSHNPVVLQKDFMSRTSMDVVKEGMRKSVSNGVIYPLRDAKTQVAAKTGTAEFGLKDEKGIYETHAWVTGYFPYDDPQISFTILLEGGGQSNNAAEVAKKIINWYIDNGNKYSDSKTK